MIIFTKTVSDLDMLINIFKTKGVKSFTEGLEKSKLSSIS
jgi:hypothetical protein